MKPAVRKPQGQSPGSDPGRGAAVAAFAIFTLVMALLLAGHGMTALLLGLAGDGILALLWLASAAGIGWGAARLVGMAPSEPPRVDTNGADPVSVVTFVAGGMGLLGLWVLGMGSLGLLNQVTAWGLVVVGVVSLLVQCRGRWDQVQAVLRQPAGFNWLLLLSVPLLALALVAVFVPPGLLWGDEPHGYDVVSYHLQLPRQWWAAGQITRPENNVYGYFPLLVEMHDLLAFHLRGGPYAGMYLAKLMHLSHAVLFVAAVWAAVRPAGRSAAVAAALLAAATPYVLLLGTVAYNEPGLLLYGALALAWTLRGLDSNGDLRAWMLAGASAGFACGTKLTAFPLLLVALPVAAVLAKIVSPPVSRRLLIGPMALLGAGLLVAVPWLIRTAIWSGGNPVFPEATEVFGTSPFTPIQAERWQVAHAATGESSPTQALWAQVLSDWRYGYGLIPVGLAALLLGWLDVGRRALLVWLLLLTVFWMSATHLQGRFFVLAVPALAIAAGRVRWRFWPALPLAAAIACGIYGFANAWPRVAPLRPVLGATQLQDLLYNALPEAQAAVLQRHQGEVFLVGDAKAFWYSDVPMERLHYRSVFDVAGNDFWPAWLGRDVERLPPDALLVIWPGELARFARTYRGLPEPPPELLQQPSPFVIPARSLKQ